MYLKKDFIQLAQKIYYEAGRKEGIERRIENYRKEPKPLEDIHNYYYIYRDVYEYSDLNATLGLAVIFLEAQGAEAIEAGKDYVEIVASLAECGFLIEYVLCDAAFDGYAMGLYIHSWLEVKKHKDFEKICTREERETIERWFYQRGRYMWQDRDKNLWVSFRPYCNQDIGVGINALTAEVIKETDLELSEKLFQLADERLMGWEEKNGNPDDTVYYNPIFALSLYFYAKYRKREDLFQLENCKTTFESMLQQQPGTGMATNYNWTQCGTSPMMMALAAHLFQDGRYKWMAEKQLYERLHQRNERQKYTIRNISDDIIEEQYHGNGQEDIRGLVREEIKRTNSERYDHVWEGLTDTVFHLWFFWEDGLAAVKPEEGSNLLKKTAGNGRWSYEPEPILPEKVVLRDGWEDDSLFVLMNLWGDRNSPKSPTTAHRYPASNEILSIVFGEQFAVPNNDQVSRDWSIIRKDMNAFNLCREGKWLNPLHNQKAPESDRPQTNWMTNAKLQFFECGEAVDASKSTLFDYFGWTSERTMILCKGKYLVVFDQAEGAVSETGGVWWHLQGDMTASSDVYQSLRLKLLGKTMNVLFPHKDTWCSVEIEENNKIVPVYQHHADLDVKLIQTGKKMGFITVFAPEKEGRQYHARPVRVTAYDNEAHPEAVAVKIGEEMIGTRFSLYHADYNYGEIMTDAEAFFMHRDTGKVELTVFKCCLIRIPGISCFNITADTELEDQMKCVVHKGILYIRFDTLTSGTMEIYLEEEK